MRLVWVVIPLILIGIVLVSNVDARECLSPCPSKQSLKLVNINGIQVEEAKIDQQYTLSWNVENYLSNSSSLSAAVILQVLDEQNNDVYQANQEVIVLPNAIQKVDFSWVPTDIGKYQLAVFTSKSLDDPTALQPPASLFVNVVNGKVTTPLKQIKNGINSLDIICKDGLELIFKFTDGDPKCVQSETAEKLLERKVVMRSNPVMHITYGVASPLDALSVEEYCELHGSWYESRNSCQNGFSKIQCELLGGVYTITTCPAGSICLAYNPFYCTFEIIDETISENQKISNVVINTDKSVYKPGESVDITIKNEGESDVFFSYRIDFTIQNEHGTTVKYGGTGIMEPEYNAKLSSLDTHNVTWYQSDSRFKDQYVSPGTYTITTNFIDIEKNPHTLSTQIDIVIPDEYYTLKESIDPEFLTYFDDAEYVFVGNLTSKTAGVSPEFFYLNFLVDEYFKYFPASGKPSDLPLNLNITAHEGAWQNCILTEGKTYLIFAVDEYDLQYNRDQHCFWAVETPHALVDEFRELSISLYG